MITFEALDVILRVQNLPGFMAGMRAGARSVSQIGTAAVATNKKASTAIYAAARKATLGLTAMAAIVTATGYKQSVEFEKQLTLVHTQAGATTAEMKAFKQPLLDLARTLPQGPIELAKGLYHVKSIGIPAAQALDALKVAAQGAMVGNADLEQTTSALGAAWLAGINGAGTFQHTMAVLNATVGAGNMRMDELVTALGTGVLPTAKLAGLGLQDVMGALALLKDEGYGAYGAMAQFATALHFFTSPTKKASDAFKQLGLRDLDLADMMRKRGMVATLALLRDRLKLTSDEMTRASKTNWAPQTQAERLLGAILPGGRGRVFRVLLNQVDRYQMKLDQIDRTTGNFHKAIVDTQKTSAAQLHIAWSSVQVDLVRLGDVVRNTLTPILVGAIGVLDQFLKILIGIPPAVAWIKRTWDGLPFPIRMTLELIALIIAQFALIRAGAIAVGMLKSAWAALRLTIMAVRGAMILMFMAGGGWIFLIMAVIGAIVLMITHWKETKALLSSLWGYISTHDWTKVLLAIGAVLAILIGQFYAVAAATAAWGIITGIAEAVYTGLVLIGTGFEILQAMMGPIGWALIGIGLLIALIVWKWGWIKQAGVDAWHWIKQAAVDAWHWIKHAGEDTFGWIKNHWKLIVSILFGPFGLAVALIVSKWRDLMAFFRRLVGFMGRIAHAILAPFRVVGKIVSPLLGRGHPGSNPLSTGQIRGTAGSPYGYAPGGYTGGMVYSGGAMDVGEHGKERIYVPTGGRIRPAGFRAMPGGTTAAAGAGDVLEVHVHSYLDGKEVSENVSKHMANKKARK